MTVAKPQRRPQRFRPPATRGPAGETAGVKLPVWLRTPPKRQTTRKPAPGPREIRWWLGIGWMLISALLLGLVAHVSIVGGLEHVRSQHLLYQELRESLALATTPLGQLDVDSKLVPDGTPIALITIARLGIDEVVVQGTTAEDLTAGPGHRRDTVYPGQQGTSIIMGRQATYGGPFGTLHNIVPGDRIKVVTGQGTATYEVFGVRRDGDLLPEPLKSGEGRLELITADGIPLAPSGTLHIDAALTSDPQETPSPVFTKEVLGASEQAMASDSGGWFPTLFWFQWLVAGIVLLRWIRGRWGMWQTWMVAVPVLLGLGAATANAAMTNLPNLL